MELISSTRVDDKIIYRCNCCGAICREDECNEYDEVTRILYDDTHLHGYNCSFKNYNED